LFFQSIRRRVTTKQGHKGQLEGGKKKNEKGGKRGKEGRREKKKRRK
jgi:hypothetical protein